MNFCTSPLTPSDELGRVYHDAAEAFDRLEEGSVVRLPDGDLRDLRLRVLFEEASKPRVAPLGLFHGQEALLQVLGDRDDILRGGLVGKARLAHDNLSVGALGAVRE